MASVAHIIRRRRQRKARRRAAQTQNRIWTILIVSLVTVIIVIPLSLVIGVTAFLYFQATATMPTPGETTYIDPIIGATELYDRSSETLLFTVQDPLGDQRRWVSLEDLPPAVIDATLLTEDPDFLQVSRFDTSVLLNQLWAYILGTTPATDNSLTGRLVRNTILPQAQQSMRLDTVLLEIALIGETNRRYTPEEILEWHLNTNYYGNDAYGIDAAARVYLGKSATELTLDEAALLAAIPPKPQFNPFDDLVAAQGRQSALLREMLVKQRVLQSDFDVAASRLTPISRSLIQQPFIAPDFSFYARQQAEDILGNLGIENPERLVSRGGLRITTTLDLDLYHQSECTLRSHLLDLQGQSQGVQTLAETPCVPLGNLNTPIGVDRSSPPDEAALVLIDVQTGEIKSIVGAVNSAKYQPGPILQPFVYFEGFRSTFNPATMVLDIPSSFPGPADGLIYTPINPDSKFRGPLNLRDAMASGLLPPAVLVADSQGMSDVLSSAHRIGINSLTENIYDLSLLERGGNVSVLDASYAYSVFAGMGVMHGVETQPLARGFRLRDPVAILKIEDAEGNLLWEYTPERVQLNQIKVFEPEIGYLINSVLADNVTRSAVLEIPDSTFDIRRPAAVVSGLTRDGQDNWTVGYTPQLVLGIHLGRSDRAPLSLDTLGLQGAAPVWQALIGYAHQSLPTENWRQPDGVVEYIICEKSGLIPNPSGNCPTRTEVFIENIPPTQVDSYWQSYEVNSQTRQLANANTPDNLRTQMVFFVPPDNAMDWWQANGLPLPPTEYDSLSRPEVLKAVQILQPDDFAYVGGNVDIRGTIETSDFQYYQLAYGQGLNPQEWLEIGGQQTAFNPGTSLGIWDTTLLEGVYTLRLTVVLNDGTLDNDFTLVTIDNGAPSLELVANEAGYIFRYPAESLIPLVANVTDNLAIDRVEFYHNGNLIGTDREWPYGFEFEITRTGLEIFRAVAYDQVGNLAAEEITVEVVRS